MPGLTVLALILSGAVSVIGLGDAATHGLTGRFSPFSDDPMVSVPWLTGFSSSAQAALHLTLAAVLATVAGRAVARRRACSCVRWVLAAASAGMGVGMLLSALGVSTRVALEPLASVLFVTMLLGPPVLGVAMLAQGDRSPATWLLAGTLGVLALTVLLGVVATDWAHPAYAETMANFGLALLGTATVGAMAKKSVKAVDPDVPASTG